MTSNPREDLVTQTNNLSANARQENQNALPDHLVGLAGGWGAVWKWAGVRATGFPFDGVLKLSSPQCASTADRLIQAEQGAECAWEQAHSAVTQELRFAAPARRAALSKAKDQLKKGRPPKALPFEPQSAAEIEMFVSAFQQVDQQWKEYEQSYEDATAQTSKAIRDIALSDRFREAIIWQNRHALYSGVYPLLRKPEGSTYDSKDRRNEELIASYWQRYCAKNDTIGFFGPIGWARVSDRLISLDLITGASLLSVRSLYFESWCIDAFASSLVQSLHLRNFLPPRVLPTLFFDGARLLSPSGIPLPLSTEQAVLLRACDGSRSAKQVADLVLTDRSSAFLSHQQVYSALEDLLQSQIISWSVPIPSGARPEEALLRWFETIEDHPTRRQADLAFSTLDQAKTQIAEAAGDAEKLDAAMAHLERTFSSLTGLAPTRQQGLTYAGRTLVYEDCVRDIDLEIGDNILADLGLPLSLLLSSARWLTAQAAYRFRAEFQLIFDELRSQSPFAPISSSLFWARAQSRLFGAHSDLLEALLADFQLRWSNLLSGDPSARRLHFTSGQLAPLVESHFKADGPGWSYARYHSPDVMIAAPSLEAINRGEYLLVLGEVHVAVNTLRTSLFVCQHPNPQQLYQALDRDLPQPLIAPVHPKHAHTSRGAVMLVSDKDYRLEIDAETPKAETGKSLPIGFLVVDDIGDGVFVRSIDQSLRFDILEVFTDRLSDLVSRSFRILPQAGHNPRVTIDRLVVSRETWRVPASDLDFALEKNPAHRFLAARRWARQLDLPRFLFFKSPLEVKPCFLDLDSPILINIFSRIVRKTLQASAPSADSSISLSEMLPGPDQLWLPDSAGNRYSSELRMIAVDLAS